MVVWAHGPTEQTTSRMPDEYIRILGLPLDSNLAWQTHGCDARGVGHGRVGVAGDCEWMRAGVGFRCMGWQASFEEGLGVNDLIVLTHLHEPAILFTLEERYMADIIYTYTGPILLAINPFWRVPL